MESLPTISRAKTWWTLLFGISGRTEFLAREAVGRGPFLKVPFPGRPIILVNSPAAVEEILLKQAAGFVKSFDYRVMARLLGRGILTTEGSEWKTDRSAIQAHFKPSYIAKHEPMIREETARALDALRAGDVFDVLEWSSRLTGRIITNKLFGRAFADAEIDRVVSIFEAAQKSLTAAIVVPEGAQKILHKLGLGGVISRRIERARAELRATVVRELGDAGNAPHSVLNVLREVAAARAGNEASRVEWVTDQILTFFLAGYETTAVSITWCLHLLSLSPEVQAKLRATPDFLGEVMHESMRLYPPIAMMGRENSGEATVLGHRFPAGTTFLLSPYLIHHSPEFWEAPEEFRPERFSGGGGHGALRSKFFPFGLGPRSCIGQSFAVTELEIALGDFLTRFSVSPEDEARARRVKGVPLISFRPSGPIRLIVHG